MKGIAIGMASPGLKVFGTTLIVAGSTAAKILSHSLAVFGIGVAIWDVCSGVQAKCYIPSTLKLTI